MTKKNTKSFYHGFHKVWFPNETEYFIFLIWGVFVCIFLLQLI